VKTVVVGSFTPSVLMDIARSSGRLAAHDLEVTEVPVASSPGQFRSLLSNELDLALTSPGNVLACRLSPANPLGELLDGDLTEEATEAAARRLDLDHTLAGRYVDRLRDPAEGLVPDREVDDASLSTLVGLRTRYLPVPDGAGGDVLDAALREGSGLVQGA